MVNDGAFQFQGLDGLLPGVYLFSSRFNKQCIGKGTIPLGVNGFYKLVCKQKLRVWNGKQYIRPFSVRCGRTEAKPDLPTGSGYFSLYQAPG